MAIKELKVEAKKQPNMTFEAVRIMVRYWVTWSGRATKASLVRSSSEPRQVLTYH